MVIDVCTYNSERDLWDIHYNVLKNHVDEFIVVEFDQTFSGKPKESTFPVEQYPDVLYHFMREEQWSKYLEMAQQSSNTIGASHWLVEFMQKESIKDALTHLHDDDIVFIGDVDEIWNPAYLTNFQIHGRAWNRPLKIECAVYSYYLNNRSNEVFFGPVVSTWGILKKMCLNHARSTEHIKTTKFFTFAGVPAWHFTSMGGAVSLAKKLTDSYTQETYASSEILDRLEYNIAENKDFLGRYFEYKLDESEWPEFLRENRDKYKHLIK